MRRYFDDDHDLFRASFRQFLDKEVVPHNDEWERAGIADRDIYRKAGDSG
ncbi:MAG: acyl-CoA dehydrogenase, partial [Actinomycetia bacterium]|nr:acyl-CoA dehydrogenase [Actinomycetes bacterium]